MVALSAAKFVVRCDNSVFEGFLFQNGFMRNDLYDHDYESENQKMATEFLNFGDFYFENYEAGGDEFQKKIYIRMRKGRKTLKYDLVTGSGGGTANNQEIAIVESSLVEGATSGGGATVNDH
ncbi:hypothetical protein Q3G72_020932 [Acer saccharum]|nr:hypothetical protein Q3G72_020932 [Acer saccharum]